MKTSLTLKFLTRVLLITPLPNLRNEQVYAPKANDTKSAQLFNVLRRQIENREDKKVAQLQCSVSKYRGMPD